jgi:GcrA cell cycle regulator
MFVVHVTSLGILPYFTRLCVTNPLTAVITLGIEQNMNKQPSEPSSVAGLDHPVDGARTPSAWTPEREARALRLYLEEGFTAAEVADALGADISRAAVSGKIRRLGFHKRQARGANEPPPVRPLRRPRVERRLPPQRPPQPLPPLRHVGAAGVPAPLASLTTQACRWPIDDPGAGRMHLALFCAGPISRGVYCEAHWTLAHDRSLAPAEAAEAQPQPHADPAPLARAA